MNRTNIEYLDFTWSPIVMRCSRCSPGCLNCWHLRCADQLMNNPKIPDEEQKAYASENSPLLIKKRLMAPLRRKKNAVIGLQFMGDLFYNEINRQWINKIFNVIERCPQHTFILLTKRPGAMRNYLTWRDNIDIIPNLLLGVSCENQATADLRIPLLLQTPAIVHFVSIEPMLDIINLKFDERWCLLDSTDHEECQTKTDHLHWVIMGGESGPKARPMKIEWAKNIVKQCQAAKVLLFYKQGPDDYSRVVKMPKLRGRIWNQMPKKS